MRNSPIWWFMLGLMVLTDLYVFFATKSLVNSSSQRTRTFFMVSYGLVSVSAVILVLVLPYLHFLKQAHLLRSTLFALVFALFIAKIVAGVVFLTDDIRRGLQWVAGMFFSNHNEVAEISGAANGGISRSVFITWLGVAVGGSFFSTFVYGLSNKYNYHVRRVKLAFNNLPQAFKGIKIVQISDIHSGSFTDAAAVNRGIDMILDQNADLILFTGDLVNNKSDEMKGFLDLFSRLKAPMGVFSILGNHDYGDYANWENPADKAANLEAVKDLHKRLGWRLMLDENLSLEKDGSQIGLIGVQNISGKPNFHSYGDLSKAMQGAENYPFKILMSHDPSHWDTEVSTRYKDIDLTLSGHTHGMQFGVEVPGFRWSPVQYVYKHWAGLYKENNQKLYVNRGFGFIGYPGRVGILPEITVLELV